MTFKLVPLIYLKRLEVFIRIKCKFSITPSQIVDHQEIFSGVRVVDRPLTEDQMMGEVLSIILGNSRVSYLLCYHSLLS